MLRTLHPVASTTLVAACLIACTSATLAAQVGPNDVAKGKSAFESSNYSGSTFASLAVDGNTNGDFFAGSVATTNADIEGWWYVDLGGTVNINSITLWNRTDCCGTRLQNFFVSILAAGTPNVSALGAPTVWQTYTAGPVGMSAIYTPPPGTNGEFVKVQYAAQHADYLQLAEVDVQGAMMTSAPEPSSLILLATGLGGVAVRVRRRRAGAGR